MSKPEADPSSGISSVDVLIPTERHPACRQREARPGSVRNVRTWPAMPREKAQAAPTVRLKVPMRRRGADCLVVATKWGNAHGAKGVGHRRLARANWVKPGGACNFSGRRPPSCDGTS